MGLVSNVTLKKKLLDSAKVRVDLFRSMSIWLSHTGFFERLRMETEPKATNEVSKLDLFEYDDKFEIDKGKILYFHRERNTLG